ncbi:MAG TPA: TetR/AcrR family transcriptional regulator [Solirubrobacteraceae bacterium]
MSRTRGQAAPLFRRLPHGPSGMGREEVARNQRARLYAAMIESVAEHGYERTTVARVIALAGVSRRAFYEQFSSKEDCFLATYDIVVARARKQVIDAWQHERGWANRMHAACRALLDHAAQSPKGARLVLVDSLGIGPRARERMQLAGFTFERMLGDILHLAPDGVEVPPLATRAIVGGVRHVAFLRMLDHRERELLLITDEVLDWIDAYRSPAASRLAPAAPAPVPHRPPVPAAFLIGEDKRARALGSVVHLTLDEGYASLTDPQIAEFAGITTEAFHRQFASKEACYLAVLDEIVGEAREAVGRSIEHAGSWPEAVHRAMAELVGYLVTHEALLRIAFVDVFEVGPAMIARMTRAIEAVTDLLAAEGPRPLRGPAIASEAVTGAVWGIISGHVSGGRLARLPALVDHLTFIVLAPYLGPRPAVKAINRLRRARGTP